MRTGTMIGLSAAVLAQAATAQSQVELSRAVYVERLSQNGATRHIEPATHLRKGDTVILLVEWDAQNANRSFTVSSAIPNTLTFKRSSQNAEAVSVDGGRSWGRLGDLKIRDRDGLRLASVEDVTHLRWRVPAHDIARGQGRITYSAVVR